jgi:hypothetical protein
VTQDPLFQAWWAAGGSLNYDSFLAATGQKDVTGEEAARLITNRLTSAVNELGPLLGKVANGTARDLPTVKLTAGFRTDNFASRLGVTPSLFIVHSTRSGDVAREDAAEAASTLAWFRNLNAQSSSHFLVSGFGRVYPLVDIENSAWHAGNHNPASIGVELTQPTTNHPFTSLHYEGLALAFLLTNLYLRADGLPPIPAFHTASVNTPGILGHDETPQGKASGKSDPGPRFDWAYFLSLLKGIE